MIPIRVLIIDDSAFARKVIREVLSSDPAIEVIGFARDGLEALEKISEMKPDVVTLDLVMPDLDGLGVLRALQKTWSPKVVVVSVSGSETELALEALEEGAVELVTKPTPFATDRLYELSADLLNAVKAAFLATVHPHVQGDDEKESAKEIVVDDRHISADILVIGTSTGGPNALAEFFKKLRAPFPVPIAIALHIPSGYTAALAARISLTSAVKMSEAVDGEELMVGQAYIAPGGMHLRVRRDHKKFFAIVSSEPLETLHHPSVDVLFQSAAEQAGKKSVGLILTGMGSDGLEGAKLIREAGGRMVAESAASCVVYGMPRCVIEANLANAEAPLPQLPRLLFETMYEWQTETSF